MPYRSLLDSPVQFKVSCMLTWVLLRVQIEFGAHQVILVRSTSEEGLRVLPDKVRRSNALTMEILQSKVRAVLAGLCLKAQYRFCRPSSSRISTVLLCIKLYCTLLF